MASPVDFDLSENDRLRRTFFYHKNRLISQVCTKWGDHVSGNTSMVMHAKLERENAIYADSKLVDVT
jgi:hypothetical protein